MLAIRMQRTGRKGHAQFRVIVQEARRSPRSGAIVQLLGNYDPHTKEASLDKEKAAFYLTHGAQPSDRVALLLQKEGVKLPTWVKVDTSKQKMVRNVEKRRSTAPAQTSEEASVDNPKTKEDTPSDQFSQVPAEEEASGEQKTPVKEEAPAEAEVSTEAAEETAQKPAPEADTAEDAATKKS